MASKLTMSLDDIIKQSSGSTLKKKKPAPVKAESSDKKNFSKFQRKINRSSSPDDFPSRIRPPQPLKVITKERPRIIRPDDVQQPSVHTPIFGNTSTGTVFSRLGSNGFHVLFKNLKSTVRKEDIVELCRAVGEVRDLSFLTGFDSLGQARVLFSSKNFAEQCVQKYNGIALDGLEMSVTIDKNHQSMEIHAVPGESKLKPESHKILKGGEIRGGLFGGALEDEDKQKKQSTGSRSVTFVNNKPGRK